MRTASLSEVCDLALRSHEALQVGTSLGGKVSNRTRRLRSAVPKAHITSFDDVLKDENIYASGKNYKIWERNAGV